ncbi:MAG: hemerythrin domain-containing protein [Bacteriovorax sp.]|nr:hemerythrin domain-containing protein [Rhizobacter sp.]
MASPSTTLRSPGAPDAIAPLRADHKHVGKLFAKCGGTPSLPAKKASNAEICTEPGVHAQVEAEIFCPAAQEALDDKVSVPENVVEQVAPKDLISLIEGVEPGHEMFDARAAVLAEYAKRAVKAEATGMFPKAKAARPELAEWGTCLATRKPLLAAAT